MCSMCSARISSAFSRPAARAASTLGVTRSTTSRTKPPGVCPSSKAEHAAATAPQESWPRTTTNGAWRTATPNSREPSTSVPATWPAVRTTNRSPRPRSKMISAASRESEQPNRTAKGCWAGAVSVRRAASWLGCSAAPETKRLLPAMSSSKASRGVGVWIFSVMAAAYESVPVVAPPRTARSAVNRSDAGCGLAVILAGTGGARTRRLKARALEGGRERSPVASSLDHAALFAVTRTFPDNPTDPNAEGVRSLGASRWRPPCSRMHAGTVTEVEFVES